MHGVSSVVSSSVSLKLSVLIPLIFAVLLLLSVAASLLAWRMVKQREKGELAWLGLGWALAGWKCVGPVAGIVIQEPSGQEITHTIWRALSLRPLAAGRRGAGGRPGARS